MIETHSADSKGLRCHGVIMHLVLELVTSENEVKTLVHKSARARPAPRRYPPIGERRGRRSIRDASGEVAFVTGSACWAGRCHGLRRSCILCGAPTPWAVETTLGICATACAVLFACVERIACAGRMTCPDCTARSNPVAPTTCSDRLPALHRACADYVACAECLACVLAHDLRRSRGLPQLALSAWAATMAWPAPVT